MMGRGRSLELEYQRIHNIGTLGGSMRTGQHKSTFHERDALDDTVKSYTYVDVDDQIRDVFPSFSMEVIDSLSGARVCPRSVASPVRISKENVVIYTCTVPLPFDYIGQTVKVKVLMDARAVYMFHTHRLMNGDEMRACKCVHEDKTLPFGHLTTSMLNGCELTCTLYTVMI